MEEAQAAMAKYQTLGNQEKASFLAAFQEANPAKTKNWKWLVSYKKSVAITEHKSVGVVTDLLTGPRSWS